MRCYIHNIMEKKVSISDIAASCNVSAMTVSRALRESSKVRSSTRALVLAKAEELGYFKVSRLGRPAVRTNTDPAKVRLILGGVGSTVSIFHSRLVNTIQRNLIKHNCECVLFSSDASYQSFLILLEALKRQSADATLIIGDFPPAQLKTLLMTCPGAILLDNPGVEEFDATFSSFNFDNYAGCSDMLEHLLASGRRNIVLLNGSKEHFFSQAMEKAYRKKLAQYRIKVNEEMILHADFTAPGAATAMQNFMQKNIEFDAVFSNDEMALGAMEAITGAGKKIMVVGFDATDDAIASIKAGQMAATIAQQPELIGSTAIEYAMKLIAGETIPKSIPVEVTLITKENA